MRMRTLPQAVKILREDDPETAVTLTALRRMVKQGRIPVTQVGNKPLIDLDKLLLCMVRTCINFMDLADKAPVSRAALPHLPAYMDGQERGPLYGTR